MSAMTAVMIPMSRVFRPSAQSSLCLVRGSSAVRASGLASKMAELKRLGMVCCVCVPVCFVGKKLMSRGGAIRAKLKVHVEIGKKKTVVQNNGTNFVLGNILLETILFGRFVCRPIWHFHVTFMADWRSWHIHCFMFHV